jgi:hypothetical protein
MTENPQDRSAQIAKLAESFGGKMEVAHCFCGWWRVRRNGHSDVPRPEQRAQNLYVRAAGNLTCQDSDPSADDCRGVQSGNGKSQKHEK